MKGMISMARRAVTSMNRSKSTQKPTMLSDDARKSYLTNLAWDLIEQRLLDGTATSQETTYFLRYGSREAELKEQILQAQKELYEAKAEALQSQRRSEELYENAINAMRRYSGAGSLNEDIY